MIEKIIHHLISFGFQNDIFKVSKNQMRISNGSKHSELEK